MMHGGVSSQEAQPALQVVRALENAQSRLTDVDLGHNCTIALRRERHEGECCERERADRRHEDEKAPADAQETAEATTRHDGRAVLGLEKWNKTAKST